MERQELYRWIELQPEMVQKLEQIESHIDLEKIDTQLDQMIHMETASKAHKYLDNYFQDDSDKMKMLFCQLECARRIYTKYQAIKIPDKIFIDTMKCFTRFIDECGKKNGRLFFDRDWWVYRQLSMNIFRIGALEYQFERRMSCKAACVHEEEVQADSECQLYEHEGENVISIHIPSDADCSKQSIDDSLEMAKVFFQTYYPDYKYTKYVCDSWLLSPTLKDLLSEKSNIRSFSDRFEIIETDSEAKDCMEWLFQVPADTDYEKLPEKTSLQKRVKKWLLDGGRIGVAYGIMK